MPLAEKGKVNELKVERHEFQSGSLRAERLQ